MPGSGSTNDRAEATIRCVTDLFARIAHQTGLRVLPFNEGLKDDRIARLEHVLGVELPVDYKTLLRMCNGQTDSYTLAFPPDQLIFLADTDLVDLWRDLVSSTEEESHELRCDDRVRAVLYHPRRIPIAYNESGGAYLCIDYLPGPKGHPGQLIFNVNEVDWVVLEESLFDLLQRYVSLLASGLAVVQKKPPEYGEGYWFSAGGRYIDWVVYDELRRSLS